MFILLRLTLLSFILATAIGCTTYVTTEYIIPAKETAVIKYNKVAVMDFTGKQGDSYRSQFEALLQNLKFKGTPIYEIIDRANIETILKEQAFQLSGIVDEETAVRIGKMVGVDAIWTGNVTEKTDEIISYDRRSRCKLYDSNSNCQYYETYQVKCLSTSAVVSFTPKLTSVTTGRLIYSKAFTESVDDYSCSGYIDDQAALANRAKKKIFRNIEKDLSPMVTEISIELKDDTDGMSKPDKAIFKNAIKFAKSGREDRACEFFRELLIRNRSSLTLNYNVGICYEIEGEFQKALDQLQYTDKISTTPDDLLNITIRRAESNIRRMYELESQFGK